MFQFELLFFAEILLCVLMLVFIHKLNRMKKQVEHIVQEVEGYIAFITEETDEIEQVKETSYGIQNQFMQAKQRKNGSKEELEEAQTHLIQTVLREYFP